MLITAVAKEDGRRIETLIHGLRLKGPYSGRLLHKIGKAVSPNCPECGAVEDIEHTLVTSVRCVRPSLAAFV